VGVSMTVSLAGQQIITAGPPTPPDSLSPTYRPGLAPTLVDVSKSWDIGRHSQRLKHART
jgi:hypothetical protein